MLAAAVPSHHPRVMLAARRLSGLGGVIPANAAPRRPSGTRSSETAAMAKL